MLNLWNSKGLSENASMADKETTGLDVEIAKRISDESDKLYKQNVDAVLKSTDTLFAILFTVQGPATALIPLLGLYSSPDAPSHTVYQALLIGGVIAAPAAIIAWVFRGKPYTRYFVAIAQMAMSSLIIFLSSGRIETHFHIFGSLAILAFYRDWRVLFTAGVFAMADHLVRGLYWPTSIYGTAIQEINAKYGFDGWQPIVHLSGNLDQSELAAWYQAADVMVVSSVKDGLNLIAKEYVACRQDEQGVLLLSEQAGCALELQQGAIMIQPESPEEVSQAINKALSMGVEEKRRRMTSMRHVIGWNQLHDWALGFLRQAIVNVR